MKPLSNRALLTGCATAALFTLGACAHKPPNELVMARQAYQQASTGEANRLKPAEVHKAHTVLEAAEAAFAQEKDTQKVRDLAYIAGRKAALAEALAAGAAAEKQQKSAAQALDQQRATQQKQTQEQLGRTEAQLGQAQEKLALEQQASQAGAQQLAQEQQARAAAEQQAVQARDALAALAAKEEARGMVITLSGSVVFRSNESVLLPNAQTRLDQVSEALAKSRDRSVVVEGHTDSRGKSGANQALSQSRADAVRQYLVSRGFPSERITAQGIGSERPVADNGTSEGRANNRRVEIIVAPKPEVSSAPL